MINLHKYRLLIGLITFVVITAVVCNSAAWAYGPYYKTSKVYSKEDTLASKSLFEYLKKKGPKDINIKEVIHIWNRLSAIQDIVENAGLRKINTIQNLIAEQESSLGVDGSLLNMGGVTLHQENDGNNRIFYIDINIIGPERELVLILKDDKKPVQQRVYFFKKGIKLSREFRNKVGIGNNEKRIEYAKKRGFWIYRKMDKEELVELLGECNWKFKRFQQLAAPVIGTKLISVPALLRQLGLGDVFRNKYYEVYRAKFGLVKRIALFFGISEPVLRNLKDEFDITDPEEPIEVTEGSLLSLVEMDKDSVLNLIRGRGIQWKLKRLYKRFGLSPAVFSICDLIIGFGIKEEFTKKFREMYRLKFGWYRLIGRYFEINEKGLRDLVNKLGVDVSGIKLFTSGRILRAHGLKKDSILRELNLKKVNWKLYVFRKRLCDREIIHGDVSFVNLIKGLDVIEQFLAKFDEVYEANQKNFNRTAEFFGLSNIGLKQLLGQFGRKDIEKNTFADFKEGELLRISGMTHEELMDLVRDKIWKLNRLMEYFEEKGWLKKRISYLDFVKALNIVSEFKKEFERVYRKHNNRGVTSEHFGLTRETLFSMVNTLEVNLDLLKKEELDALDRGSKIRDPLGRIYILKGKRHPDRKREEEVPLDPHNILVLVPEDGGEKVRITVEQAVCEGWEVQYGDWIEIEYIMATSKSKGSKAVVSDIRELFDGRYQTGWGESDVYENDIVPIIEEYGLWIGLRILKVLGMIDKETASEVMPNVNNLPLYKKYLFLVGFRTIPVLIGLTAFLLLLFNMSIAYPVIKICLVVSGITGVLFMLNHKGDRSQIIANLISIVIICGIAVGVVGGIQGGVMAFISPFIIIVYPGIIHSAWNRLINLIEKNTGRRLMQLKLITASMRTRKTDLMYKLERGYSRVGVMTFFTVLFGAVSLIIYNWQKILIWVSTKKSQTNRKRRHRQDLEILTAV